MGILRRFREWREDKDGVLTGPDINADSVDTGSLVIGGTLYEEDDNSPINVSGTSSTTYTLADSSVKVLIIPQDQSFMDGIQINGDTSTNYSNTDTSDTKSTGDSKFRLGALHHWEHIVLSGEKGGRISYGGEYIDEFTGVNVRGHNDDISPPITQFTIRRGDGTNVDVKARVYRRVMDI